MSIAKVQSTNALPGGTITSFSLAYGSNNLAGSLLGGLHG
jgi:hypothetical protein